MTKAELQAALVQLEFRPSRRLGQNFLFDQNIQSRICEYADVGEGDVVLEIGPGLGALTAHLLEKKVNLTAIEYDVRLAEFLTSKYESASHFRLIQADACRVDFKDVVADNDYVCLANLPYSISSVFIAKITEHRLRPRKLVLLLQREMAERLTALPRTKAYGALSVRVQALYSARLVKRVSSSVFWPSPKVESAVVVLDISEPHFSRDGVAGFNSLVKLAFSQRRKKLGNLLGSR
jgi:16S rRNA (adenine1518-N6/adenine1519-N6)-dimethyltransferase